MTSSVRLNKILLALADIAIYVMAFYLSFYLRYGWELPARNVEPFTFMLPWFIMVFMILLIVYDLYSIYIKFDEILASLVCIVFLADIINVSLSFLFRQFAVPRSIFLISSILQLLLLGIWRYVVWKKGLLIKNPRQALIIGYPGEIRKLLDSVNVSLDKGLLVTKEIRLNNKDNFSQSWSNFISSAGSKAIEVILICSSVGQKERDAIVSYALDEGKMIMLVPGIYEILLQQAKMVSAGDVPIMQLQGILAEGKPEVVKRITDIVFSLLGLVILMPVALAIALAIKLDSPGPVFYSQMRAGMRGQVFSLYKFRTMVLNAEKLSGPVMTDAGDRRITRVGRFLRRTRLDEIPQFINVLKGDMSLVGPRPERPFFLNEFREEIPEFEYRHQIRGGVTGLAQVEGNYTTDPSNKLRYDLYYAQKKSLMMDIVILLRTARVMLQRKKAS
ncbi:MAG: sugar transferase [Syntrophomonadaceae bacterium]|jgi:exopolysaccharide biosynthesis polyprenyl glycosylphosphotransferase|nr:sugar transferase [Syntrophomonadaceae bacterium]